MRFTVLAQATNVQITYENLLDTILIAFSATAAVDLFDLVKIKGISVWALSAIGTPATVQVVFDAITGDRSIHTDTSLGIQPAYIKCKPSIKSLASFWNPSGGGNAFSITAPPGSVIDVKLSFKTSSAVVTAAQNALVAATIGELYFRGLDGQAIAGTNFPPPVGLQVA